VPRANPVIELVNVPDVVPSVVLLFAIVGVADVLQQIPDAVIVEPPLDVMVPPELAEFCVILLAAMVLIIGAVAVDVKLVSGP
jgi:hypothetical protein